MRKITPLFVALAITLTSCSSEDTNTEKSPELLKSYKVVKDAQGRYSVDYDVSDNVSTEIVENASTKSKEIYLFTGKNANGKSFTEALFLDENQLKLGFVENNQKRKSLVIEDKDIVLAKGEESSEFLEQYSIADLGDDDYQLNFKVKEGVNVTFIYNDAEDIYEVHLQRGKANGLDFSKTYTKTSEVLKIDFVNYLDNNESARGGEDEMTQSEKRPKRPRMIIIG